MLYRTLLLAALVAAPAVQAAYKCRDEKGITHIGDTPPAGCANVVMYEISRSGNVLRTIEPTLTPEQVKAKREAEERAKEAAKAADEQRRKDIALLSTYSSEKDFDTTRDVNLKPVESRQRSAKERLQAVEKRLKELDNEMEFYKAGKSKTAKTREAPPQLVSDLERTRTEKATLEKSLVGLDREMAEIRAKADTDKRRWVELKQMHREGRLDLRSQAEIEASARKAQDTSKPGVKRYNLYLVPAN